MVISRSCLFISSVCGVFFHCFSGKRVTSPIFGHFSIMCQGWKVSHGLYGTFTDVGKSEFVSII